MRIVQQKAVVIDELARLIPTKSGATFSQLWQIFYYTRMFKYMSHNHYAQIKPAFKKICTQKKLLQLCDLGYLKSPSIDVYCATNKVLPILDKAEFNTGLLPPEPVGTGEINERNNTDIFVRMVKEPYFKMLLYPNFGFLRPDALLVQLNEEERKYKLTFLEIEACKPKWNEYLEVKKEKYIQLSGDRMFYDYWNEVAPKLALPIPTIEQFKFSVSFYCTLQKDFGPGFNFITT